MNTFAWMASLGRAIMQRACRACIERCGVIAGDSAGGRAASALFFEEGRT